MKGNNYNYLFDSIDQDKINLYTDNKTGHNVYMFAPYCNTIYVGIIEYC